MIKSFLCPNHEICWNFIFTLVRLFLTWYSEVEKFVIANTQELAKDKWLCPLSGKKFKGPDFVRKHIFNKHGEKVDEVKKEVKIIIHKWNVNIDSAFFFHDRWNTLTTICVIQNVHNYLSILVTGHRKGKSQVNVMATALEVDPALCLRK
jgi:hypothetical protein